MIETTVRVIVRLEFLVVVGNGFVRVLVALEINCGFVYALQVDAAVISAPETLNTRSVRHGRVGSIFSIRCTRSDVNGNQIVHRPNNIPNQIELALVVVSLAQEFARRLSAGSVHVEW